MRILQRFVAGSRGLLLPLALAIVASLFGPLSALAAYAPGAAPVAAPPGAFPTVLASQTIGDTGATVRLTSGAATLQLVVPPGAFPTPVQLTVYKVSPGVVQSELPAGYILVDGFAIGWSPPTPAQVPLTFTVSDPSITASTRVFETTSAGLVPFPGASVVAGSATVTFTNDPGFVLGQPPATPGQIAQAPATTSSVLPTQLPSTGAGGMAARPELASARLAWLLLGLGVSALVALGGARSRRAVSRS